MGEEQPQVDKEFQEFLDPGWEKKAEPILMRGFNACKRAREIFLLKEGFNDTTSIPPIEDALKRAVEKGQVHLADLHRMDNYLISVLGKERARAILINGKVDVVKTVKEADQILAFMRVFSNELAKRDTKE